MLSSEQVMEISRLAGLWATSRVRKAIVQHGCGAQGESPFGTQERERKADSALHEYLRSLMTEEL